MTQKRKETLLILLSAVLLFGLTAVSASAADVPRMSAEELKGRLGDPDLVIIDVRIQRDWDASTLKIPGAVWEDFFETASWAEKYPKDKIIVLYCD